MLNKKAIAAFAAGATLLSGLAFAAPAFVSAPAFAANIQKSIKDATDTRDKAKKTRDEKQTALDGAKKAAKDAYDASTDENVKKALNNDGTAKDGYEVKTVDQSKEVWIKANTTAQPQVAAAKQDAATAFYTAHFAPVDKAQAELTEAQNAYNAAVNALTGFTDRLDKLTQDVKDTKKAVDDAKTAVDSSYKDYLKAYDDVKAAKKENKKAARALSDLEDSTPEDQQETKAYKDKRKPLKKAADKAEAALKKAVAALKKAANAFTGFNEHTKYANKLAFAAADTAVAKYDEARSKYEAAYKALAAEDVDVSDYTDPADLVLQSDDYNPAYADADSDAGQGGKGDKGQGGQGEGGQGESGKGDKGHGDKPGKPGALPNAAQASANLMHAQVVLQDAAATKTKTVKDSNDAKANLDKAKAQFASLKAQFEAAQDNYHNNFELTGKADTDAGKAAKADVDAAKALMDAYAANELANAQKDYAEKSGKALVASQAFNTAKEQYRLAYNLALRVEASAVKGFQDPKTIADAPLDFPAATAAAKAEAGKLAAAAAQAGKAADAAAAGAHGAKAAAGENGGKKKNNAGEDAKKKLGQTGATVALAAVAASVLAGVGAALRKIRH